MKNWLRISITVLACALLLIYVVDVRAVWQTLSRCDPIWAVVALGAFLLDRVGAPTTWTTMFVLGLSAAALFVFSSATMRGPSVVAAAPEAEQ